MIGGLIVGTVGLAARAAKAVWTDIQFFRECRRAAIDAHRDDWEDRAMAHMEIHTANGDRGSQQAS